MLKLILLLALSASAFGCVNVGATPLGSEQARPKLDWRDVVIYQSEEDVPGSFEKVALLDMGGDSNWTNESGMWRAARKKAGKLGANGIIMGGLREPSSGSKVAGAVFGVPVMRHGKALAIYVGSSGQR